MTIEELRDYVEEQRNLDIIPYHVYSALIDGIDTLEQQPCEDAISRKYAIDKLKYGNNGMAWFGDTKTDLAVGDFLENLPPVTPKESKTGHWIPVSERLPKAADIYRVTRYYPNNVMNPQYIVDACAFDGSNTWYNDNRINHDRAYADNVIAWQENPEPYKPQESEDKE